MVEGGNFPRYEYRIAAIPCSDSPAEGKQQTIIDGVKKLAIGPFRDPKPLNFTRDTFDLKEISIRRFEFAFRYYLNRPFNNPNLRDITIVNPYDHLTADDNMGVGCPFSKQKNGHPALTWIAQEMAPIMLVAMDAYRMDVEPTSLFHYDSQDVRIEAWKLYRWKIGGVKPISFYDDRLCLSAFGVDASEVARRVSGEVPHVKVIPLRNRNGVLIQAVDDYVETEEFLPVRERIMAAIQGAKSGV